MYLLSTFILIILVVFILSVIYFMYDENLFYYSFIIDNKYNNRNYRQKYNLDRVD